MPNVPIQDAAEEFVLTTPEQLHALGAPASRALFQGLLGLGEGSIKEIAQSIGKSPHSLYHHMDKLLAVGLVVVAGERRSGARNEKLYRPISHLLATDPLNRDPAYLAAIADNGEAGYRQAARALRRSLLDGRAQLGTEKRNALALQFTVPLITKQLHDLTARIDSLVLDYTKGLEMSEEGEFHLITLGLSPAD